MKHIFLTQKNALFSGSDDLPGFGGEFSKGRGFSVIPL
jgi:hypothetical protein